MSYIHPGIDTKQIIKHALNSKQLSTLSTEENTRRLNKLKEKYTPEQILRMEARRHATPKEWSKKDDILTKLGILVSYKPSNSNKAVKSITHFDSNWVNQKIPQYKINITEKELIDDVKLIEGNCNLRNTNLESLGTVEQIGGSLSLYTNTPLKDLSNLKKIKGSVIIYAKNEQEMQNFLEKIHLKKSAINGKTIFIPKTYI